MLPFIVFIWKGGDKCLKCIAHTSGASHAEGPGDEVGIVHGSDNCLRNKTMARAPHCVSLSSLLLSASVTNSALQI